MRFSIRGKLYVGAAAALCGLVLVGIWLEHRVLPAVLGNVDVDTHRFLTKTLFDIGGQPVRVFFLIKTVLYLIFLTGLSHLSKRLIQQLVRHNPDIGQHHGYVLTRIVSSSIYVIGILIGIHVERINIHTLVILGGTLGIGIGFGLQSLAANLIAGFILLIEQPIRIGDRIEFDAKSGEVVKVGGRSSWIRTYDNAILIIPNSEFVSKEILNWTLSDPKIRVAIPVSVAYGSDSEKVMQILLELGHAHPDVMKDPPAVAILSELGASSITFTLRIWTLKPANYFGQLRSDIYLEVVRRFKEEKIELPFSQLDLHVKSIDAPVSISRSN